MFEKRYQDALEWIHTAAKDIRNRCGKNVCTAPKSGHQDIVTEADRRIEQYFRQQILNSYVNDGILGEEGSKETAANGCLWLIDPIDGTTNYASWGKHFSISIAFSCNSNLVFGIVMDVMANRLYKAYRGKGAWENDIRLQRTDSKLPLADMMFSTSSIQHTFLEKHPKQTKFIKLAHDVRGVRSLGCVSLEMCHVATGENDVFIAMKSSPWDYAAAKIILDESGGAVYRLDGSPLELDQSGGIIACTNKYIFQTVEPYLN